MNSDRVPTDLHAIARKTAIDNKFIVDRSAEVNEEVAEINKKPNPEQSKLQVQDLTKLLWSSIDNRDTRDLDQVEYAEQLQDGTYKLRIGIADVDAYVKKNDPIDRVAANNTTSVYTGIQTFPMLPEELSTDKTSLLGNQKRRAIVTELVLDAKGEIISTSIYIADIFNCAQLDYDTVGAWLEGAAVPSVVSKVNGLQQQLELQSHISDLLYSLRLSKGALEFESIEPEVVESGGNVTNIQLRKKNKAKELIENFMIAANSAVARSLNEAGFSALERVVKTPERWDRIVEVAKEYHATLPATPDAKALAEFLRDQRQKDPAHFPDLSLQIVKLIGGGEYTVITPGEQHDGHFGLAVQDYAHSTAPNRRFADLVTQRMIKSALLKAPPCYTDAELEEIALRCTEMDHTAKKIERFMRKVIAADFMRHRIGQVFSGIITGVKANGTYLRIIDPPVEGRVMKGEQGLDVGQRVHAKLIYANVEKGFIDFEAV